MNDMIETRISRLENSNRRWKLITISSFVLGAICVLTAAQKPPAVPEILQARRFELIDAHGQPAIVLQSKEDGASVAVWGPEHRYAAVLVAQQKKSALMLVKGSDAPEVFAEAVDQGGQIGVTDGRSAAQAGTERAALNLSGGPNGFGVFQIVNGRPESLLTFSKSGGGLELRTPGSKAVTRVIGSDAGGHIQIVNRDGQVIWEAPMAK